MSTKEQYEQVEQTNGKKWSFWGIGLIVFLVLFLSSMFILEAAFQPRESFTATLIAYIIGIIILAIFGGLVRDKSRVLISIPILLIIVFGAGYLFHYVIQAPAYNPFAPVSERADLLLDSFEVLEETTGDLGLGPDLDMQTIRDFSRFAFVIDLIIALPLFIFGTLAITWFAQIFTSRPRLLTILSVFFALVFFLIGLVLTPFIHLLFSGVVIIGSDLLPGALYIGKGFSIFANLQNATQEEMDEAIMAFNNASEYFQQSAENLEGLRKAGIIALAGAIPVVGVFIENMYYIALAALFLASGLGPFANGTFHILDGMEAAMGAFGGGFLSQEIRDEGSVVNQGPGDINDTLFNIGIEQVNEGLLILGNSTDYIDDALEQLSYVNLTDVVESLRSIPGVPDNIADGLAEQLGQIDSYLSLFEGAVRVIDVLLTKPSGSDYATLTHFLYGAYNLFKAGDFIGEESAYNNTSVYFTDASDNFTIVYDQLQDPEVVAIANSDTPILNVTVSFLTDMVGLTVPLCSLGSNVAVVFTGLQDDLTIFNTTNYEDIGNYPELISNMNDLRTTTNNLLDDAINVDGNITLIRDKAQTNAYGELSSPALSFSDQLIEFNFTTNIANANYIANSFYYMFNGLMELSFTFNNITQGHVEFNNTNYVNSLANFQNANESLHYSISNMTEATYYMNQTESGGMVQLDGTRDALLTVRNSLLGITDDVNSILDILTPPPDPSTQDALFQTTVTNIVDTLASVNTDLDNINAQ